MWRKRGSISLMGMKVSSETMEISWRFLKKLKIYLPYDPDIPLLGIYPKECKSAYNRHTCMPRFTPALFTTAKLWNLLSVHQLMNG
jgi:hypothetical protein